MKIFIDFDIKDFDLEKANFALKACKDICTECDEVLDKCLLGSNDCPVKNAIEALGGMIRIGKGIRRYEEIGNL